MGGIHAVGLFVQIVLARLLLPDNFGTIAIVLAFINIAQVFVQSGLSTALIQKQDADELDFSTVFYASLAIAAFFYILLFVTAPLIANFYNDENLIRILRVMSLTLFFGALKSIQNAYISKNMMFKRLFRISLVSVLISGAAGIISAYMGLGVWALIIYYLTNGLVSVIIMLFKVEWRPALIFSFQRLKSLFSFGGKLLVSSLIHTFYMDLRTLVIGRIYSPDALGYYNRGQSIPNTLTNAINGSVQAVMLPTMSSMQDNEASLKLVVRRSIKTTSFLIFPIMAGLAVVAEPIVSILLGDKWLPAVPFLQMFCLAAAFQMLHTANLQAISALGRSDIYLKLEIIKKIVGLALLAVSIPFGIYAIAAGFAVSTIVDTLIHTFSNKDLYHYTALEQSRDILPALILSLTMGTAVYLLGLIKLPPWQLLFIQIPAGAVIYIALAKIFKVESWNYIINTAKEEMIRRKK